jgi:hypothetical protein
MNNLRRFVLACLGCFFLFSNLIHAQNVGIGIPNPTERLHIVGAGPVLLMDGTGSNMVRFNTAGMAAPSFTTRSVGTKIVLFPEVGAASTDYGIGIEAGALWHSVPTATTSQSYRWYAGTTQIAQFRGDGQYIFSPNVASFAAPASGFTRMNIDGSVYLPAGASYWIGNAADANNRLRMHLSGGNSYVDYAQENLYFRPRSNAQIVFDSIGHVGIGNMAPGVYRLNVNGYVNIEQGLRLGCAG